MNEPMNLVLDKSAFLRWAEGREGHFELKGNRVVMMTGGTRNHARITSQIAVALSARLDLDRWAVTTADLAVEIGEDVRYPDVLVEARDAEGDALSTTRPILVVEVLSPSSLALDLNVKAREYMSLESLECYIVAAQDEPRVWVWQRTGPDRRFPDTPQEIVGREASIAVPALGIEIQLADVYRERR